MTLDKSYIYDYENISYYNILEINPNLSDLYYIANNICNNARSILINEYQNNLCSIGIRLSSNNNLFSIHLPTHSSFGNRDELNFDKLLLDSCGPKIIIIYDMLDVDFVDKICGFYKPDIVLYQNCESVECLQYVDKLPISSKITTNKIPKRFAKLNLNFYGNYIGIETLQKSFDHLDGMYREYGMSAEVSINFVDIAARCGFYEDEHEGIHSWSWSGPVNSGCFYVPVTRKSKNKITLYFFAAKIRLTSDELSIFIDEHPVHTKYFPEENKIELYPMYNYDQIYSLIEIRYQQGKIVDDQSRRIGLAIHKVKIEDIL